MQIDRVRLSALRSKKASVSKPVSPYLKDKPNPVSSRHLSCAMSHGMELSGQSGMFENVGAWDRGGGFLAKRDLRTKLKMTNVFYAPGYSSVPTTAQGGGYGLYRGRFHCVGNDLTTPIPGTDHRPFGFNEIAAFYTYYEVHSCKIKLHVQNVSYGGTRGVAAPAGPGFLALFPISYDYSAIAGSNAGIPPNTGANPADNTLSGPFWSREILSLQPHVQTAVMTNPEGGKPWAVLEQSWTTSQILGTSTADEFNFKGACTPVNDTPLTPPTNVWNYVVSMNAIPRSGCGGGGVTGAAAFGQPGYLAMVVQVSLEWDVTFFDARLVQPSEAPDLRNYTDGRYPALSHVSDYDCEPDLPDEECKSAEMQNPYSL